MSGLGVQKRDARLRGMIRAWLMVLMGACVSVAIRAQPVSEIPRLSIPSAHTAGLQGGVKLLATNPGSTWFATLGVDETLCIWGLPDGRFLAKTSAKGIQALAILPHSHRAILATSSDIRLVDVDTFTVIGTASLPEPATELFSSQDGRVFALTFRGLYRLDPITLQANLLARFEGGLLRRGAISSDGRRVVVVLDDLGAKLNPIRVYSLDSGTLELSLDARNVQAVDIDQDRLAVGSRDNDNIFTRTGHIVLVRVPDGQELANIAVTNASTALLLLRKSPAGAEGEGLISAYIGGIERIDPITGVSQQRASINDVFNQLAPLDSAFIATGQQGVPDHCDTRTLRCTAPKVVQGSVVTQALSQSDGGLLLIDAQGNAIHLDQTLHIEPLYASRTLAVVPHFKAATGPFAIGMTEEGQQAILVNRAFAPTDPADLISVPDPVTLAASQDGNLLATRSPAGTGNPLQVSLYDLSRIPDIPLASPPRLASWSLSNGTGSPENASGAFQFAFTPDAKLLVAVDVNTGSVHRFDVVAKKALPVLTGESYADRSNVLLANAVSAWTINGRGTAVVMAQHDALQLIRLDGLKSNAPVKVRAPVAALAASPQFMFIALEDGSLWRWDEKAAPEVLTQLSYPSASLLYVPHRELLLANATDGSLRFLDAHTGREKMALALFSNRQDWLVWTPKGQFDASDGGWSELGWAFSRHTFTEVEPVEDFFDDFYTPGIAATVLRGDALTASPVLAPKERRTPRVAITLGEPALGKVSLDVRVEAPSGVSIHDIHLTRNGVLLKTWMGVYANGSHLKLTADLMAGPNRFRAYAFNQDNVRSTDAFAETTGPDSLRHPGELYVVVIGINRYRNPSLNLNYAKQDALLVAGALQAHRRDIRRSVSQLQQLPAEAQDPQTRQFASELASSMGDTHVYTLADERATREHILQTLAEVSRRVRPEDALVVYYAGHGVALGNRYYLLPHDVELPDTLAQLKEGATPEVFQRSAISDTDLRIALADEQGRVAALIVDACQSGQIVGDQLAQRRGPMNSRGLAQLAYDKRMFILAASLSTQTASEQRALEHGLLTYTLVMRGLLQDDASPTRSPAGPGTTTLSQWLQWTATHVSQGSSDLPTARGFKHEHPLQTVVQLPRLFSPPAADSDLTVAIRPLTLDPETLTVEGFTDSEALASKEAMPAPVLSNRSLVFQPSTLGPIHSPLVSAADTLLAVAANRVMAVDLEHGAVRWTRTMPEDLLSVDISSRGEVAVLSQTESVSVFTAAQPDSAHLIAPASGFTVERLVRWIEPSNELLVVTGSAATLYTRDGSTVRTVNLRGKGIRAPTLASHGDWLYMEDATGQVLTFQFPSLTPGPTAQPPSNRPSKGSLQYSKSLRADPQAKHLLRIQSDGSLVQGLLPQGMDSPPLIPLATAQALCFSADGSSLAVADTQEKIHLLQWPGGRELKSWPAGLKNIESLEMDASGHVLIATNRAGGLAVWSLPDAALKTWVPGGFYLSTIQMDRAHAAAHIMLANPDGVRTFTWPSGAVSSRIGPSDSLYLRGNRILGKKADVLSIWDVSNVNHSDPLQMPGSGALDITPDGHVLAWAGPTSLQVFNTGTREVLKTITGDTAADSVALSNDGRAVFYVVGDQLHEDRIDTGAVSQIQIPRAPLEPCCQMAVSPSGKDVLIASADGHVSLYGAQPLRTRRTLQLPTQVDRVAFVPGQRDALLAAHDGQILRWKTSDTNAPERLDSVESRVMDIAFDDSGSMAMLSTDAGELIWLSLRPNPKRLGTTIWLESTGSWLTVAADGRFEVVGDNQTPVAVVQDHRLVWGNAAKQLGFTPGLLEQLVSTGKLPVAPSTGP